MSSAQSSDTKGDTEPASFINGGPPKDRSDSDTSRSQQGRPSASCPLRPASLSPQIAPSSLALNTLDSHERTRSLTGEVPVLSTRLHSNVLWPGDESEDESSEGDYTAHRAIQILRNDGKTAPGTGLCVGPDIVSE